MDGQTKPGGRVRGRFGVTRDADGSFATIYVWPWYWRYPFALCAGAALLAFVMSLAGGRDQLAAWIFGGAGAVFILSVVYELFVVLAGLGVLWWLYQAVGDSNGGWRSTVGTRLDIDAVEIGFHPYPMTAVSLIHLTLQRVTPTHRDSDYLLPIVVADESFFGAIILCQVRGTNYGSAWVLMASTRDVRP